MIKYISYGIPYAEIISPNQSKISHHLPCVTFANDLKANYRIVQIYNGAVNVNKGRQINCGAANSIVRVCDNQNSLYNFYKKQDCKNHITTGKYNIVNYCLHL
jgi:hypothetical protein